MTTAHLSDSEFVDFVEGTLDESRAQHVDTCPACGAQAETLLASLRAASSTDVPEPSSLYWTDMSARVREAVAAEAPRTEVSTRRRVVQKLMPLAAAAALAAAVSMAALFLREAPPAETPAPVDKSDAVVVDSGSGDPAAPIDPETTAAWEVLTSAASDVEIEDAQTAGMALHAGALDHAVLTLSAGELTELGRLLQSEMKRASN